MIRDTSGTNSNAGGGVGLWVDENLEYEPISINNIDTFQANFFESQFIKVKTSRNKFIIVGNVYRPPQTDLSRFNELLESILTNLSNDPVLNKAEDIQILSDSNIDLLQYKKHNHTNTYVDTLLSNGLLPLITLPTRITQNSATIIDHISTSHKSDRYVTGVIISSLSDHLPIFYIRENSNCHVPPSNTKSRKNNAKTLSLWV